MSTVYSDSAGFVQGPLKMLAVAPNGHGRGPGIGVIDGFSDRATVWK